MYGNGLGQWPFQHCIRNKLFIGSRCTKNHLLNVFMFVLEECTKKQNRDSCRIVQCFFKGYCICATDAPPF